MKDLTPEEDVVLMGLLREIVQADGEYSADEQRVVSKIQAEMGDARFQAAMAGAAEFASRGELKDACKTITRGDAQRVIFQRLMAVASSDGISTGEQKPLEWLAQLWPKAQS